MTTEDRESSVEIHSVGAVDINQRLHDLQLESPVAKNPAVVRRILEFQKKNRDSLSNPTSPDEEKSEADSIELFLEAEVPGEPVLKNGKSLGPDSDVILSGNGTANLKGTLEPKEIITKPQKVANRVVPTRLPPRTSLGPGLARGILSSVVPQVKARGGQRSFGDKRKGKFELDLMGIGLDLLPKEPAPEESGSFSSFEKYIDIKNGSLTFAGKASVHSNGVDFFGSAKSIQLSTNDILVQEELGHGNYGTVKKVVHRPTKVTLAMKEVRLALEESKFKQILMELDILHKCDSPYIVDFFGAFFVEGCVYMCIEYMDGGSLDQIYGGGLEEDKLAYVAECVIRGLKSLKEEHNIIHRDVKPTNILVNTKGKVKLCDFGVSGNLVASKAKTNIGCQSYMPPERIANKGNDNSYTVQSDVWSLGISLVETATGKFPYPESKSIFDQLTSIVHGEPPKLPNRFSKAARDFIARCCEKLPEKRPGYNELLNHPWLVANRKLDREALEEEFAELVVARIRKSKIETNVETEKSFNELNELLLFRQKSLKKK